MHALNNVNATFFLGEVVAVIGENGAGFKIPVFLTANNLQPLISDDLKNHSDPIQFLTPNGGKSIGYKAELLPGVCTLYIDAQEAGVLRFNQEHIASDVRFSFVG